MCIYYLLLFSVVSQATFLQSNALRPRTSIYRSSDSNAKIIEPKYNPQVYKKTAELLSLIENVYNKNKESEMREFPDEDSKAVTRDYPGKKDKDISTKDLMKTIQRNYDMRKSLSNLPSNLIRTHYISNPETIDRFQRFANENRLQSRLSTSSEESSSTEDYVVDKNLKDILSEVRRRALYRIAEHSGETKQKSSEDVINVKYDKTEDYVTESQVNVNNQNDKVDEKTEQLYEDDTKDFGRNNKEDKFEKEDAWEVITKKYNWNTDNTKENDNKENIYIDWDQNKNKNDWVSEKTDHEVGKDKELSGKYAENWQEKGKKFSKSIKNKFLDDEGSVDFNSKNTNKRNKNSNKKRGDISDWDNKYTVKNDWGAPKKKVSKTENDQVRKKKTENWEDIDHIGNKHESALKNKWQNQADRFKTKKEHDWDTPKREWGGANKGKRDRTTRRWKPDAVKINEWSNYNPRKESKAKKQNYDRNVGTFMRTSIPYVGKKGIYDDK